MIVGSQARDRKEGRKESIYEREGENWGKDMVDGIDKSLPSPVSFIDKMKFEDGYLVEI